MCLKTVTVFHMCSEGRPERRFCVVTEVIINFGDERTSRGTRMTFGCAALVQWNEKVLHHWELPLFVRCWRIQTPLTSPKPCRCKRRQWVGDNWLTGYLGEQSDILEFPGSYGKTIPLAYASQTCSTWLTWLLQPSFEFEGISSIDEHVRLCRSSSKMLLILAARIFYGTSSDLAVSRKQRDSIGIQERAGT